MVPDELKWETKSKGLTTPRKKKPKELAVITECCTGCAGSGVRGILSGGRLHVLGPGRRQHSIRPHRGRSHSLHRLQKVPQQRSRRLLPRRLPWDAIAMVETTEVEKESRSDGD